MKEIDYQPVTGSSNVAATAHDPENSTMYVRFHDGAEYKWADVTAAKHRGLRSASSVGGHLHRKFEKGERIN